MCKTKDKQSSGRGVGGPRKADVGKRGGAAHHVKQVEAEVLRRKFQRRSQILSPTRAVERPWLCFVTCLPETGGLQTNSVREGRISVKFVSTKPTPLRPLMV